MESGKAVYRALQEDDYDEAARQHLLLMYKKAQAGDIKEAMQLSDHFLNTLICDEGLMGCIADVPEGLLLSDNDDSRFLAALISLYAGKYEQALELVNAVSGDRDSQKSLFVKSRALTMLGRYAEADDMNVKLADMFDMTIPDAKVLYMIAMLNEMHIGEPGLEVMRTLVAIRPKYDKGIHALRMLMKRHGIMLDSSEENELIEAFNSGMSEEDFDAQLKECRAKTPKSVSYLIQQIKKQKFNIEQPIEE